MSAIFALFSLMFVLTHAQVKVTVDHNPNATANGGLGQECAVAGQKR